MIDLSRTRATAVEHLKDFLEYAERGPAALAQKITVNQGVDEFDSDFEMDVAIKLREFGWVIQSQVGVSKFRIDLGVIHPDHPGKYLAGIECDGATYHSSPSARDRDRVRHIILENLGWDLIRLWSTDYFIDAESALQKMHLQLVELLAKSRAESADELLADDGLQ
jgi:very-short-patch-repair endonuclease